MSFRSAIVHKESCSITFYGNPRLSDIAGWILPDGCPFCGEGLRSEHRRHQFREPVGFGDGATVTVVCLDPKTEMEWLAACHSTEDE